MAHPMQGGAFPPYTPPQRSRTRRPGHLLQALPGPSTLRRRFVGPLSCQGSLLPLRVRRRRLAGICDHPPRGRTVGAPRNRPAGAGHRCPLHSRDPGLPSRGHLRHPPRHYPGDIPRSRRRIRGRVDRQHHHEGGGPPAFHPPAAHPHGPGGPLGKRALAAHPDPIRILLDGHRPGHFGPSPLPFGTRHTSKDSGDWAPKRGTSSAGTSCPKHFPCCWQP